MRNILAALVCGALVANAAPAVAAPGDDIGAAVKIVNLVTADYEKDLRRLATGDNIRQDDLIEVGSDGVGELRLRDDTQLALGPGSRLLLDQFVYDPEISGGAIVLHLVKGAFRFVTGIAAKPAYVIHTPSASITDRGTVFDVYVQASGLSWLLLIDGAVEVCNDRGDCGLHDEPGKLIRITPEGDIGDPVRWASLDTDGALFKTAFPFVVDPPSFEDEHVFTEDDIVGGAVPDSQEGTEEVADADQGGGGSYPSTPTVPLKCWNGWKQVTKGWSKKGWRVKSRHRDGRVIYCARPVPLPPDNPPVFPDKPKCIGGKSVLLKTFPPKWQCNCPVGSKRHQLGKNLFICKKAPPPPKDPEAECLKKGWKWTGKYCVPPDTTCPKGYIGKPPKCIKLPDKVKCPKGYDGTPPNCKKQPVIKCPSGYIGQPPNCKKLKIDKPDDKKKPDKPKLDKLKGIKEKLDKFKKSLDKD